jgi:benzoylformate decarboxylase
MNEPRTFPQAVAPTSITGRAAFLRLLIDEGIDYLFGNPGTTELAIMDALVDYPDLGYVLGLQEGIVVAMADGYARASNRLAAANVHVAPGLGNAMGALYNAKFFGSPLLVTAGQHEQGHGLTEPMLYDPLVPIAQPMVKWATEVTRLKDLPRVVHRAAKVALTPPTGPVFISLPGDILEAEAQIDLGRPTRVDAATRPSDATLVRLAERLLAARNPVLIAGHELATTDALREAAELAELLGAPVLQQTVQYGAHFLSEHPAFLGALTRNQKQVHEALSGYDLLVFLGADQLRMSLWSAVDPMPEATAVIQIGARDWELAKNYPAELAIRADLKETLRALLPVLSQRRGAQRAQEAQQRLAEIARNNWSAKRARLREDLLTAAHATPIDPRYLTLRIVEALPADVVLMEEALTTTFQLPSLFPYRDAQCYFGLASGGIGFAVGGAVGVSLALPDRPVVAIIGDGSAMYSIQALWTAAHLKRPITYVIANNRSYRILKDRQLARRGNRAFFGMDLRDPELDFVAMAQSMGVPARRVIDPAEIVPALRAAIAANGPSLLDVSVADGFGG